MWGAVEIEFAEGLEEAVLAQVAADCLGIEELRSRPQRRRLRIWWPSAAAARAAEVALSALGAPIRSRTVEVQDGRWVERYQARQSPFPLGARFMVFPSGRGSAGGERIPILLRPGRAFGTGEHATTRLCAEALERWVRADQAWVDLGTGSGILAVVAAHCGARVVLALDLDAVAIEVARDVVRANGVAESVRLCRGTVECAAERAWSGVVANIETPFFLRSTTLLTGLLDAGGLLIAAGIPAEDAAEVSRRLALAGCEPEGVTVRDGWCALVHRRCAGPLL